MKGARLEADPEPGQEAHVKLLANLFVWFVTIRTTGAEIDAVLKWSLPRLCLPCPFKEPPPHLAHRLIQLILKLTQSSSIGYNSSSICQSSFFQLWFRLHRSTTCMRTIILRNPTFSPVAFFSSLRP
eukprot:COSAG02_NODE_4149_length_5710_cov_6.668330_4_plen_127_part_00